MSEFDNFKTVMETACKGRMQAYGNAKPHKWFSSYAELDSYADVDTVFSTQEDNGTLNTLIKKEKTEAVQEAQRRSYFIRIDLIASVRRAFRLMYVAKATPEARGPRDQNRYSSFSHASAFGWMLRIYRWLDKQLGTS